MVQPVILFRPDSSNRTEFFSCTQYCHTYTQRSEIPPNRLVFGRYSVLPFYEELYKDIEYNESTLVNHPAQHNWIANFNYYRSVEKYTFKSWREKEFIRSNVNSNGPFVVKGCTNSRKHQWNTHMFAENFEAAIRLMCELRYDMLLGTQELIVREYVPLEVLETGLNGLPFSNEWRFFFYKESLIDYGFYWSGAEIADAIKIPKGGITFARKIAKIISNTANFFVVDIAKTASGDWILVEVNDGSMSGLSMIPEDRFYHKMSDLFNNIRMSDDNL